jgi:hypothetical protein
MIIENENTKLCQMLHDSGFSDGWVISGTELILWEHDDDPPTPLKRPK